MLAYARTYTSTRLRKYDDRATRIYARARENKFLITRHIISAISRYARCLCNIIKNSSSFSSYVRE